MFLYTVITPHGDWRKMKRDFTYIDDIIEGVVRVLNNPPLPNPNWDKEKADPGTSIAPYKIYNIGKNKPVKLMEFIETLEKKLGKKAKKENSSPYKMEMYLKLTQM